MQSGSYTENPETGELTLIERTAEPVRPDAPRKPGEPAFIEPPAPADSKKKPKE